MKRSINRWTTTVATAAILGLPVVGVANTRQEPAPQQQPQPTQPQAEPPQRPTPQPTEPRQPEPGRPQPTDPQPQPQPQPAQQPQSEPSSPSTTQRDSDQTVSPQEHLSQAKQAADSITTTSVPAKSRSKLAELKQHLAALNKSESASAGTTSGTAGAAGASWGTDVAAIDKLITEMTGGETTGAATASTPGATGTSGSKAAEAVALDDATRSKLMEVRAHITAYAAGKAGATTPKTAASTEAPSAASPSSGSAAQSASPAPQSASPAPTSGEQATPPAAGAETQPQTPAAGAQAAGAQPEIDADAARRHLMAARETLSQLTQLPAATQLTGEARTQVAQLISNFNELITTQSNWRASYAKVNSNLTALIGPENGDAEATGGAQGAAGAAPAASAAGATGAPATGDAPTATTAETAPGGTAGSVGTSGTTSVEIDPAIRAKLVEFRQNLTQFQKASGGAEK